MQEPIPDTFCGSEREEHEDCSRSTLRRVKSVKLARMSEKSYELLCKLFAAVAERTKNELESIVGRKFVDMPVGTTIILKGSS